MSTADSKSADIKEMLFLAPFIRQPIPNSEDVIMYGKMSFKFHSGDILHIRQQSNILKGKLRTEFYLIRDDKIVEQFYEDEGGPVLAALRAKMMRGELAREDGSIVNFPQLKQDIIKPDIQSNDVRDFLPAPAQS